MSLNKVSIQSLIDTARKATPGPWVYDNLGDFVLNGSARDIKGLICELRGCGAGFDIEANGIHIANLSPENALTILEALMKARDALKSIYADGSYKDIASELTKEALAAIDEKVSWE